MGRVRSLLGTRCPDSKRDRLASLVSRLVSRLIVGQRARAVAGATAGMASAAVLVVYTGQLPVTATVTMGVRVWLLFALVAAAPALSSQARYVG